MGQTESNPCLLPNKAEQDGFVGIEKMAKRKGNISIVGRYTTKRSLHSDYTFVMKGDKPKVLGTGMSGPVQLAQDKNGRQYAVKSFKKQKLNSQQRNDLQREVEIYLSLDHPHIARLEQVYETEDEVHLVMEFMAGGELYEHLSSKKMYTEEAAAGALHQMLLAVAYLHAHNICHRDLKLENFLYESKDHAHLKLIDFGFAKIFSGRTKMSKACGSLHYVAPEVLAHAYTEKADMWSIGVMSHMLLTGSPVFRGSDDEIMLKIRKGQKQLSSRFGKLSNLAQDFVQSLLVLDPSKRLSAQQALEHPFLASKSSRETSIDAHILDGLRKYTQASRFRRACLSMMAWSLSQEDRQNLRDKFLEMDVQNQGTISLPQFKAVLEENYKVNSLEAERIFAALDTDHDNTICYSEFLAAVLQNRVRMHEDILRKTFARFDQDGSGIITVDDLRKVLGDTYGDVDVRELLAEADADGNGSIDYEEFLKFADMDSQPGEDCHDISNEFSSEMSPSKRQRERRCALAGQLIDKLVPDDANVMEKLPLTPLSRKAAQVSTKGILGGAMHNSLSQKAAAALLRASGA